MGGVGYGGRGRGVPRSIGGILVKLTDIINAQNQGKIKGPILSGLYMDKLNE